jgi:hypothetical protein
LSRASRLRGDRGHYAFGNARYCPESGHGREQGYVCSRHERTLRSLFNWLPSSHHHFTGRGLVIMLRGFQTMHLAARPERRDNHSQHFSRRGLGRRVERCDAFST